MGIASFFSKIFNPKKELIDCIKGLISLIENDKQASLLLKRIDGIEREINAEIRLSTKYQDLMKEVVSSINLTNCGDTLKFSLDYSKPNCLMATLHSKNSVHFKTALNIEDGVNPTNEQLEWMCNNLLISVIKEGLYRKTVFI